MRILRRLWARLLGTARPGLRDADLQAELEFHLAMLAEENVRRGMRAGEAHRAAVLQFGALEPAKESYRDQHGLPSLQNLARDLRIALRALRRAPSVSIPAVIVLALGIGSAAALYAVVYSMWLRPLPYPDSGRLVSVTTFFAGFGIDALASPDYGSWQGTRSMGPLAAYSDDTVAVATPAETIEATRVRVSGNLLDVLRVAPIAGRAIQQQDDAPAAPKVAMLSEALSRNLFGDAVSGLGKPILIGGEPFTVVGVLPPWFRMPGREPADVLTPLALSDPSLNHASGSVKILRGIARLQPGISLAEARAELSTRLAASRALAPQLYGNDVSLRLVPLHAWAVQDARAAALILTAAMAAILLIATSNIAGLLVARAAGRTHEIAIRRALGASRWHIARHLLTEGILLGAVGTVGGLLIAQAILALAPAVAPASVAPLRDAAMDRAVVAVIIAASSLCVALFSFAPLVPVARLRLRRALVVAELAGSLALLACAGVLFESLANLRSVAPGFRTDGIVTASLSLRGTRYEKTPEVFRRELRDGLEPAPWVVSLAFADALAPGGAGRITAFSRADRPLPEDFHRGDDVIIRLVDPSFFETFSISLRAGRTFDASDHSGRVAVVNRTLADRYFSGETAIGKQVDGLGTPWKTVIGVVADTRNNGLRNPPRPEIYLPFSDANSRGGGITSGPGLSIAIRVAGDPAFAVATLRSQLRSLDPSLLAHIRLMRDEWAGLSAAPRFQAFVFGGFAALAALMATSGVYGVLSHVVVLRRREIGIRMALGARPSQAGGIIVREALVLAAAGSATGVVLALAGSRYLGSLLYQVQPRDPRVLAITVGLLMVLAVAAGAIPAYRAAREDPSRTLRLDA